jgi:hypothetical protein
MADKTKAVVTFESHERTVVRRSRRTLSAQAGQILTVAPERPAARMRARLRAWWRTVRLMLTEKIRSRS